MSVLTRLVYVTRFALILACPQSFGQSAEKLTPKQIFQTYSDSVVRVKTDKASGTGFFVKNGTLVATCFHVIRGAGSISVEDAKGSHFEVQAVFYDKDTDAAILKLTDDSKHRPIPVGDYSKLTTGDDLSVIGSPLGLDQTLSVGIVSAKRNDGHLDLIQMSAAVSHGSSGGPVLNSQGQFVGFVQGSFEQGQLLNLAGSSSFIVRLWSEDEIPVTTFYSSNGAKLPDLSKGADFEANADPVSKRKAASKSFAEYYNTISKELMNWRYFWNREMESRSLTTPRFMKACSDHCDSLMLATRDFQKITGNLRTIWSLEELTAFLKWTEDFSKVSAEMAKCESDTLIAAATDERKIKGANLEHQRVWNQIGELQKQLLPLFKDKSWFDFGVFAPIFSPAVFEYFYGNISDGEFFPDTLLDRECYIGYAKRSSRLIAGCKIVAAKREKDKEFTNVKDWAIFQYVVSQWKAESPEGLKKIVVKFEGPRTGVATVKIP